MTLRHILLAAAAVFFSACASASPKKEVVKPQVILIGVDGATWKVIDPLMKKGKLPNIRQLITSGVKGHINTFDAVSPTIWTTIATGKPPNEHGITGFMYDDITKGKTRFYNSSDRKTKAIWNILSQQGKRTGVFNYIISWPAEPIFGFMVSDNYMMRGKDKNYNYPPDLAASYRPPRPPKRIFMDTDNQFDKYRASTLAALSDENYFSVNVLRSLPCEVFLAYTRQTDIIQHVFWKFMEPEKFRGGVFELDKADVAQHADVIKKAYEAVDSWIGRLLKHAGENTVVIVASDHGFQALDSPYLPFSLQTLVDISRMKGKIRAAWLGDETMQTHLSSELPIKEVKAFINGITTKQGEPLFTINEQAKTGYLLTVSQNSYPLKQDNEILVDGQWHKAAALLNGSFNGSASYKWDFSGTHDFSDGVFIMSGGPVKKDISTDVQASVYDIAPTILYLAGLPTAKDMPGRVLMELFTPKYVQAHPLSYITTYEAAPPSAAIYIDNDKVSAGDGAIAEQLRAIGYLP